MQSLSILITGAARGIGRDSAFALAKRGHRVLATTHTEEQAVTLRGEAAAAGVTLTVAKLDITSPEDISHVVPTDLDVLMNNAAIPESGPIAEIPLGRVQQLFDTNVLGTLRMTQYVAKHMLAQKSGRIILVSSVAGRLVLPYLGPYHMTKYAIEAMGDALRMELAPHNIHVSMIEPGLISTGFNERMAATKYEWLGEYSAFADDMEKMMRHDATLTKNSHNTESIVQAAIHAVESAVPKSRYTRPFIYSLMVDAASLLPDSVRDKVMRKFAGL